MEYAEYLPVIIEQARVLADAAREMEPDAKIPSCPEWDVAKLVRHTGTAHRWSRGVVQTREPLSPKSIDLAIPDDAKELPDWLEESAAGLSGHAGRDRSRRRLLDLDECPRCALLVPANGA
jgi:hypothetical protein